MKIVVGLGNPGLKYVGTPHNIGFETVELLAERCGGQFKDNARFRAQVADARVAGERVLLVKPQTFMNLSGEAVGALMRFYKVDAADLVVIFDDVDLEVGRIRIRPSGGSGGHNGLRSIIQHIGTEKFVRVRMGVGRGVSAGDLVSHVLRRFAPCHRESVDGMMDRAVDAVYKIVESGVEAAMNSFNSAARDQS